MRKLLIIDGNNLCHRVFWTNKTLTFGNAPIGMVFGFLKSLIRLRKKYNDHLCVIVWDTGGSARRDAEAQAGVEAGIIPSGYKASRKAKKDEDDDGEHEDFGAQIELLQEGLNLCRVFQVAMLGVEADDLAYSYVQKAVERGDAAVVVTSDKDYYQLLDDSIVVLDDMKHNEHTKESFIAEYGFGPKMWIEVGALMGDSSDEIHGVPGWGIKTACKYVCEYGTADEIIKTLSDKEKPTKKERVLLDHVERIHLALSLKKMDFISHVPKLRFQGQYDDETLRHWMLEYGFVSLMKDAKWLTR